MYYYLIQYNRCKTAKHRYSKKQVTQIVKKDKLLKDCVGIFINNKICNRD